ncbi:MAG: GNAT family N-acetyltransferase [Myxococcota bacterium]
MSSIFVRPATLEEATLVARNNAAMALETERLELDTETALLGVQAVIADVRKGFYLLAEQHGEVIGQMLVTYEWSDWRNQTFWWLQSVYVVPGARRSGVFRRLFDDVVARAREAADVCGLRLYVERDNHRAHATYEALGMLRSHYDMFELPFESNSP